MRDTQAVRRSDLNQTGGSGSHMTLEEMLRLYNPDRRLPRPANHGSSGAALDRSRSVCVDREDSSETSGGCDTTDQNGFSSGGQVGGESVPAGSELVTTFHRLLELMGRSISADSTADSRIPSPVVSGEPETPVFLSTLFDRYYQRSKDRKAESSWSGYRTLVRKWEAVHHGRGPDVRSIDEATLQSFFESVTEWHSERSWQRNRDLLLKLLKTGCPRDLQNKDGSSNPVMNVSDIPVWELPPGRWFRERPKPETKRGGHRKRNLELLTVEEFGRVLASCGGAKWKAPDWWRAYFGLVWFCGPRFEDEFRYQWNEGPLNLNLSRGLISSTESKCGGVATVPLPSWLADLFRPLWKPTRDGQPIFTGAPPRKATRNGGRFSGSRKSGPLLATESDIANRGRSFDPEYKSIWERAGVEVRFPHELRGVCVSHWLKHAPKYRFAVTGHSVKSDVQLHNYVILDDEFRAACESFPFPMDWKNA